MYLNQWWTLFLKNMKKVLFTLCLFVSTLLHAQNATLAEIEKANAGYNTIQGKFVQTKTLVAKGNSVKSDGLLYISGENQMAQHYQAPSTDLLIINGNDFFMIRGKKKNRFNTGKNKMMRGLRNTLLYCVHGRPAVLAQENGAEITTVKKANGYEVVLTSTKKTPRGYAKIVLLYDLKTKLLTRMQMDEYNGNSTLYEMNGLKTNQPIDASMYAIPEK